MTALGEDLNFFEDLRARVEDMVKDAPMTRRPTTQLRVHSMSRAMASERCTRASSKKTN
jgi:hypothetical protein